jgi:hypothetical protein
MKHFDVQKSIWFGHVGIVKIKTKFFGMKYYIGIGTGLEQSKDEQQIARVGMPIEEKIIVQFFKQQQ